MDERQMIPQTTGFGSSMVHAEPNATHYVLGFAFTKDMRAVVVIVKRKPMWQAGKLNGIGGKVESGETPLDAMVREFAEETGLNTDGRTHWHLFDVMRFRNGAVVHCYAARLWDGAKVFTMEEEEVLTLHVAPKTGQIITTRPMINNLMWLIPKAYHQMMEPAQERMLVN